MSEKAILELTVSAERLGRAIAKASAAFVAWNARYNKHLSETVLRYERRQLRAQSRSRRNQPRRRKHGRQS